jgi:hypothetical protein
MSTALDDPGRSAMVKVKVIFQSARVLGSVPSP